MANLQAYRGKPVNVWRIRDKMAFDGVLEEVLPEGLLVRLSSSGVPLESGDKCIFLMQDMIAICVFTSRRIQSFLSRLDRCQERLDFNVLATFPANASADMSAAAAA